MIFRFKACQVFRYAQTPVKSIRHNMGNMIAAARGTEITIAKSGTPSIAKPPPNPPFDIPANRTAGTATK